ncbi:carboxypeptidase-like regulatory domain-containing protein [Bacteroides sp. 51]|uniref:carboxypeptidase-like regulatory domain-containing protein n=1 Tax=Bacteroides sp. 51 TaxID=2302938 RepID=UPI0013D0D7C5|nr:carboxypeptidase-like regulatory domain-containing protein [Bacteroides sp. 51]NDV83190.1 carboxypeptidase-like regulatory domain-containing protein [Bacteroides sp. 51]
MKQAAGYIVYRALLCSFLLLAAAKVQAQDNEWLNRKVQIAETRGTRYQLLRHVSEQTGYLFVYDSQTLNNDAQVEIRKGEYTLHDAIVAITGNRNLQISLIGNNHIALRLPGRKSISHAVAEALPGNKYFTVSGAVYDLFSKEPVSSATVGVVEASIGTVTNRDGRFRISLPDSMMHVTLRISHVGYESLELKAASRMGTPSDFMLEPKVVSLQEVVVRVVNPRNLLQQMLDARPQNYSSSPISLTAFYREGVEHKKRNVDLTEAVLKVYKPGFDQTYAADQVKLVKMRRILDKQERDTIITKVKSGIHSTLLLDVIKSEPDFLDSPDAAESLYDYTHSDIAVIDNRLANVISFEQRKAVKEPLYRGELFIDTENNALLEARFEVNPAYVEKATNLFIEKRSKNYKLTLRDARYTVSYKPLPNGKYYMNHVRGELEFRVRRKRQWFSSSLRIWFELVTCKVDTEQVQSIPRSERLSPRTVFSETQHPYDVDFWENFNVILPEDELRDLIINNLTEVMETP